MGYNLNTATAAPTVSTGASRPTTLPEGTMEFVKVNTARTYIKYSEAKPGDRLVAAGAYMGPENGNFGINHIFKQRDGKTVCLNSSGQLNWLLKEYVTTGQLVNVIYGGKEAITKGPFAGKEAHKFELEVGTLPTTVTA